MADDDDKVVRVDFGRATTTAAPLDPSAGEKRDAFAELIEKGLVLVSLDTRVPGVSVPATHEGDPQLGLHFSYRFNIDDFVWDDAGVRASLSFGGQPFFCDIPWAAVFLLRSQVTGEAFLFPESVPEELAQMIEAESEAEADEADAPAVSPIAAVGEPSARADDDADLDVAAEEDSCDDEPADDEPPPSGGPRLTLVKG